MLKIVSKTIKNSKELESDADDINEEGVNTKEDAFSTCPICSIDFVKFSVTERQTHMNTCAESTTTHPNAKVPTSCFVCGRNLELYTIEQRQSHMNRCFDNAQKTSDKSNEKENEISKDSYICMVCEKDLTNTNPSSRIKHLKMCLKLHNINKEEGKKLLEQWQQNGTSKQTTGSKRSRNNTKSTAEPSASKRKKVEESSSDAVDATHSTEKSLFSDFQYSVNNFKTISDGILSGSIKTVHDWLTALSLQEYEKLFLENGYDSLEVCSEIENNDFQDAIQIGKVGHKKKLLLAATQLKKDLQKLSRQQTRNQLKAQMTKPIRSPMPREFQHKIDQNRLSLLDKPSNDDAFVTPKKPTRPMQEVCHNSKQDNSSKLLEMLLDDSQTATPPKNVASTQPIRESRFMKKMVEDEFSFKRDTKSSGDLWKMSTTLKETDCNVLGVSLARSSKKEEEDSILDDILEIDFTLTQKNIEEVLQEQATISEEEVQQKEESKEKLEENTMQLFESVLLEYRSKFLHLYDEFKEKFNGIADKANIEFDTPSIANIIDADFLNCVLEVIEQSVTDSQKEQQIEELDTNPDTTTPAATTTTTVIEIDTSLQKEEISDAVVTTECEVEITRKEEAPKPNILEDSLLECELLPQKPITQLETNEDFVGYFTQSQHDAEEEEDPMTPLLNQLSPLQQQETVIDVLDDSEDEQVTYKPSVTSVYQDNLPSPPLYFSDGEEEKQQQDLQEKIYNRIQQLSQNTKVQAESNNRTSSQSSQPTVSKKSKTASSSATSSSTSTQPTKQTTLPNTQPKSKSSTSTSTPIDMPNFYQMSALELKNLSKQYGLKPSNSKTVLINQLTKIYSQKTV